MNRRDRRHNDSKVFSHAEVDQMLKMAKIQISKEYDAMYSMCLATALACPPLNFGSKRVCDIIRLFFGQIDGIRSGVITIDEIKQESEKLGLFIKTENNTLEVYIDPKVRKKNTEEEKLIKKIKENQKIVKEWLEESGANGS